jgi:hypothetical protein
VTLTCSLAHPADVEEEEEDEGGEEEGEDEEVVADESSWSMHARSDRTNCLPSAPSTVSQERLVVWRMVHAMRDAAASARMAGASHSTPTKPAHTARTTALASAMPNSHQ